MRNAYTVAQVRAAEAGPLATLPAGTLMQRAAAGLAAHAAGRLERVYGARVVVLAGGGDNGADALWAGARLARRGAGVVVLAPGKHDEPSAAALLAAGGRIVAAGEDVPDAALPDLAAADLVLDGLVGIGGKGGLRPPAARLARLAAPAAERTVAVDVPSGVDADTGAVAGDAVRAGSTVTFGAYKRGLFLLPGASYVGDLELVDIGLDLPQPDLTALDDADVAARFPDPGGSSSKYTRGVLGLVAGSSAYTGAAVLSSGGALRGGAGFLRFVSVAHAAEQVRLAHPEVVVTEVAPGDADAVLAAGRVQAWAVGPGIGTDADSERILAAILGTDVPVLVDADGLTVLARRRDLLERSAPTLLTPHDGEFTRLVGGDLEGKADAVAAELAADRLGAARRAAADLGATVLLKGSRTVVVDPAGAARVNTTGTGWLGTAGSGDVLSGLCGSLLASGLSPLDAGSVGAYLHGLAASLVPPPLAAGDLPGALPTAYAQVRRD